jgi:GxxExxY protein
VEREDQYRHNELTGKIIGCAMRVHTFLGPGFPESIYEKSLLIELVDSGLCCASQVERSIYYKGCYVGLRRLDIMVEDKIILELKAISDLDNSCYNKLINYLKIFDCDVGLLLNFGEARLQFRRFVHSRHPMK